MSGRHRCSTHGRPQHRSRRPARPRDGVEAALEFYRDRLGFDVERVEAYREGDQPFFDVRLAPAHVIHLWPTDELEPPSGDGFNHVALIVEASIGTVKERLAAAGVPVESELESPLGATGRALRSTSRIPSAT